MVDSARDRTALGVEPEQSGSEDHIALIYESPEERLSAVTPLIKVGLEKGELCLYISNDESNTDIVEALKEEHIDVEKAVGTGGLILTHKKEIYFKLGRFDPDWTIRVIRNIAELAKSYGFTAMRIMSEMTWTLENVPGVERWSEYEAKMNSLNPGISLRIICQYDRRAFPPESLLSVVRTHPKVVSQGAVFKNPFFVPADQVLQGQHAAVELERIMESIRLSSSSEAELQGRDLELDRLSAQVEKEAAVRRSLEIALEESRQRFKDFAERASDWAWELGDNGTYTYSSSRVRDILGLQVEEVLGRSPLDLVAENEVERVTAILTKAMAQHAPITALEKEVRHRDGHSVYLEMSGTPLFDQDGTFLGYRGVDRDITGRKAAKNAIDESRKRAEESEAEVEARDRRIRALEEDIARLKDAQQERDAAVASIKEILGQSQEELANAGQDLDRLRQVLEAREEEIREAQEALNARQSELEQQRTHQGLLQQNLADLEKELARVKEAQAQAESLAREKEQALEQAITVSESKAAELAAALAAAAAVKSEMDTLTSQHTELKARVEALEGELSASKRTLEAKEAEALQAAERLAALQATEEARTAEMDALKDDVQCKAGALAALERERDELRATVEAKEKEAALGLASLKQSQDDLQLHHEEMERLRDSLRAKEAELATAVTLSEGSKADLAEAIERADGLASSIGLLEDERTRLNANVQELEEKLATAGQQVGELTEQLRVQEEEMASIKSSIAFKDVELNVLRPRLDAQEDILRAQEDELEALREALRLSEEELLDLRTAALSAQAALADARDALGQKQVHLNERSETIHRLNAVLEAKEAELAVLKAASCAVPERSENDDRFRALFEQAAVGIATLDLQGRLLEGNSKLFEILGYRPEELIGKTYRDVTHRDDLVATADLYQRLMAGELPSVSSVKRYVRKLGGIVWANTALSMVRSGAGEACCIMAVVDDRTDHMLAEEALREREERECEERYQHIIEAAAEGVWTLDRENNITFINRRMADILGLAEADFVGRSASEFLELPPGPGQGAPPLVKEVKLKRKDGGERWTILSTIPILDRDGQPTGTLGLATDVTDLRRSREEELKAKEAFQAEARRLGGIINAVAAPMLVTAEDGSVVMANPAAEAALDASFGELRGKTLADLLVIEGTAARRGNKVFEVSVRPLDGPSPGTVVTLREAVPVEKGVDASPIVASSETIAQDLSNSLTAIIGSVSLAKEYVIPEGRMYGKLRQIEDATSAAKELAYRLVDLSQGKEPSPPRFAEPTLYRPPNLIKGKGKVLLVDENEGVLEATGDLLRHLGYTVEVARDIQEAAAVSRDAREGRQPFRLAILDERSEGIGPEGAKGLAAENPGLLIIVSSGYLADPALTDPAGHGYAGALPKPYTAEELSKVVAEAISQQNA